MNIEEKYEIWINYRTRERGNWSLIEPGWNCTEKELSYKEMLSRKEMYEKNHATQTVYDLPLKVIKVSREVLGV